MKCSYCKKSQNPKTPNNMKLTINVSERDIKRAMVLFDCPEEQAAKVEDVLPKYADSEIDITDAFEGDGGKKMCLVFAQYAIGKIALKEGIE